MVETSMTLAEAPLWKSPETRIPSHLTRTPRGWCRRALLGRQHISSTIIQPPKPNPAKRRHLEAQSGWGNHLTKPNLPVLLAEPHCPLALVYHAAHAVRRLPHHALFHPANSPLTESQDHHLLAACNYPSVAYVNSTISRETLELSNILSSIALLPTNYDPLLPSATNLLPISDCNPLTMVCSAPPYLQLCSEMWRLQKPCPKGHSNEEIRNGDGLEAKVVG